MLVRDRQARARAALLLPLVVLLGTLGCKSARPAGPRLVPEPTPLGRFTQENIENGWITVSVGLPHRGRPPFPVVLNPVVPDHELLALGIGVVRWQTHWEILRAFAAPHEAPAPTPSPTPPPPGSEDGVGRWILRSSRPGDVGRAYFQLITTEARRSIPRVIDYLQSRRDVDPKRIGISGSSTGGFTALQAMAEEPRLAAGAVQVACGDYRRFLRSSSLALDDQERWLVEGEMVLDPQYSDEIDDIEPIGRADDFPPRPLLLLSGTEDRAIPPACVESTADVFGAAYARAGTPDRFEWIELEGRGHNPGPEAEDLVLDFFGRWLERPDSARRR